VAEELTTDEQAIWATQARVSDSTAMETLLMPLPVPSPHKLENLRHCQAKAVWSTTRGLNVPIG